MCRSPAPPASWEPMWRDIAKTSIYEGIKSPAFIGMSDARAGRPALRALPLHRLAARRYGIAARLHAAPVGFLVHVDLAPLEVPSFHLMRSTHERRRMGRGYRKNARVRRSRATGTLSSTAPDPTRPPAPGWR